MTVKATVKYIHLCKTPLLSSESGNSADLERMLGLPCPRDFNRWRFSLWYRVKPIAKILANSSQCNSGFVLFFFLSSFLPLDVFCSRCLLPLLSHACCLLPSPSLLLTFHCMLPVHRPILNIIPNYKFMFPPLDKIYQTALKYCINFCFKSSPVIQYSAVYNLFNLTELFSINSLLSFSHHCPPCNLGELQTFSPSQSHISLCFYSIMIHQFFPYVFLQHDLFPSATCVIKPTSVAIAQKFISARCHPVLSPSTQSCILACLQQKKSPSSLLKHFCSFPHCLCHHFH